MSTELISRIKSFGKHKGEKGNICVIGGSFEYSGAPFFTAISALKTGVDLSFIVCENVAAPVIKTYSPELIVFGIIDRNYDNKPKFPEQIIKRVTTYVVGPGLSRDPVIFEQVHGLLLSLNTDVPLIFDGDGISLFTRYFPEYCRRFSKILLTPNVNEYAALLETLTLDTLVDLDVIIYLKGEFDKIITKDGSIIISEEGSPRRCGGIGDVLSGVQSAMISMSGYASSLTRTELLEIIYKAGTLVRHAAFFAFKEKGRSMSALDVINWLGKAFEITMEE